MPFPSSTFIAICGSSILCGTIANLTTGRGQLQQFSQPKGNDYTTSLQSAETKTALDYASASCYIECARRGSDPHGCYPLATAPTGFQDQRVYHFRHVRTIEVLAKARFVVLRKRSDEAGLLVLAPHFGKHGSKGLCV